MRSIVREEASEVGLLLFDEPSASLDPAAEHGATLNSCSLVHQADLWAGVGRSVQSPARTARQQDHDVLVSPVREPDKTRGPDPVSQPRRLYRPC